MIYRKWLPLTAVAACTLLTAACGRSASGADSTAGDIDPTQGLVATTPAGTKPVSNVVWALYRDVNSLDPVFAFDYPENTADTLMCESLLKQQPDGSITSGLASPTTPNATTLVLDVSPAARFWDGKRVTAEDVVYSLGRAQSTELGGYYTTVFNRVSMITATGPEQVTITLKKPDYWLEGELASMGGIVIEKQFAQWQGKNYGTPAGSIMCTGRYKFKSWTNGVVTAIANTAYWNSAVPPKVTQMQLKGVIDTTAYTTGLETGAINGSYAFALSTLNQLRKSGTVDVYQGQGWSNDAFIVSNKSGVLGDVRVRQALSLALDRRAIISQVYLGAALMPKWLANPGSFGYAKPVFNKAYDSAPYLSQNLAQARQLVQQAGATGKTVTLGTSAELSNTAAEAGAYQAAAQAIGLKVKLASVSATNYINFFISDKARQGIDGFFTTDYGDFADPAQVVDQAAASDGSENYAGWHDPALESLLDQARSTADPNARAALVAQAQTLFVKQLYWIPNAQPTNLLLLSKNLTGSTGSFAYMFSDWADHLGGK